MPSTTKDASPAADADGERVDAIETRAAVRSIETGGRTMRAFAASGVLVNTGFDLGLSALSLLQAVVLAALLTRSDYGVWGVLVVSLGLLAQLKYVGIGEKFIQQDEPDQQLAFQKAFTLELLVTAAIVALLAAALPVIAVVYGQWKLVPPGAVLLTVLAADALQAPLWIYYRKMDFVKQRTLQAIQPLVTFVVTIALAIAGAGYWALAIGIVAGQWVGATAALVACPFALRWRFDKGALRHYATFSAPIFVGTVSSVVVANGTMLATNAHLGLAGAGAVTLAGSITAFTSRVDALIGSTLYPAICAIQGRLDLLRESFVKANRLALMWAMPFGVALALFAPDLIRFGVGERWRPAVSLLQITGLVAAINHIGFNWDDYYRARSQTVPIAVGSVLFTSVTLAVGLPLLFADGLTGLAVGIAAGALATLLLRAVYITRLFEGFAFARHGVRAVLPTIPAVAVVLIARSLQSGARTLPVAIAELTAYVLVTVAATWLTERPLLREVMGYLRAR